MELRTHTCGELRESNVGEKVRLAGWLSSSRDLGAVIFFVLRDFYGYTQAVVSVFRGAEGICPLHSQGIHGFRGGHGYKEKRAQSRYAHGND